MKERTEYDPCRTTIGDQICMGAIFVMFIVLAVWIAIQVAVWGAA